MSDAPIARREPEQQPERETGSPFAGLQKRRGGRRPKLLEFVDGELRHVFDKLLVFIEQGAFDHVAAQAMGVSPTTWTRWMSRGRAAKKGLYRQFFVEVTTARSKARLLAELEVRREDPKFWLRNGPGKTKQDDPGWTEQITVVSDPEPMERLDEKQTEAEEQEQINDLATTLLLLQQHGFATVTDHGKTTIEAGNTMKGRNLPDKSAEQLMQGDEDEDVDLDGDDKGYFPERSEVKRLSDEQSQRNIPGQGTTHRPDPDDYPEPDFM